MKRNPEPVPDKPIPPEPLEGHPVQMKMMIVNARRLKIKFFVIGFGWGAIVMYFNVNALWPWWK